MNTSNEAKQWWYSSCSKLQKVQVDLMLGFGYLDASSQGVTLLIDFNTVSSSNGINTLLWFQLQADSLLIYVSYCDFKTAEEPQWFIGYVTLCKPLRFQPQRRVFAITNRTGRFSLPLWLVHTIFLRKRKVVRIAK